MHCMSKTVKIFFIAAVALLTYDVSATDSTSNAHNKNHSYKDTGSWMNFVQIADLETETETEGFALNTPAVILTTLTSNYFFLRTNQKSITQQFIFNSRSILIVQHKLIT